MFALWLVNHSLLYEYEPRTFTLIIDDQVTTFTPDFYVNGYWFEIKNSYNATIKSFQEKLRAFKIQYPKEVIFVIIGEQTWNKAEAVETTIANQPDIFKIVSKLKQVICVKE